MDDDNLQWTHRDASNMTGLLWIESVVSVIWGQNYTSDAIVSQWNYLSWALIEVSRTVSHIPAFCGWYSTNDDYQQLQSWCLIYATIVLIVVGYRLCSFGLVLYDL